MLNNECFGTSSLMADVEIFALIGDLELWRNGDLIYRTYLVVTLPEINCCWTPVTPEGVGDFVLTPTGDAMWARWIDYPGENLIEYAEIEIGGQRIDRQYGEWMHIWNQLTLTNEKREGYHKMIGHTTELTYLTVGDAYVPGSTCCCDQECDVSGTPCNTCAFKCALPETTLFIPLLFWFCRNPGLALPMISLQYHQVKINIQLRDLNCVLWAVDSLSDGSNNNLIPGNPASTAACGVLQQSIRGAYDKSLVTCSLFIDYIFLDRDERRFMAQKSHEFLIEQIQDNGTTSVATPEVNLELDFTHPCKEIFFYASAGVF